VRIVSLCPSLTELVFDLGRGDDLVGVTRFCVHPSEGVAPIEKVGGTKNPKVDRIVSLAPDLVLLNEEENRVEDAEALRAAGLRCHVSFPRTAAETAEMVRSIGEALGRPERAEAIAGEIEARAERARAAALGRPPVTYACLIWRRPWMAAAGGTFIDALLGLAGGANVFADRPDRYPEVSAAELAAAAPGAVLLTSEPFPFREEHAAELAAATGLPRERFVFVDGEMLSWHGSRTPRGIDYAASLMSVLREAVAG
jgi:ABC-type Fe3+-hydroxamate transport system substrate-binding protein